VRSPARLLVAGRDDSGPLRRPPSLLFPICFSARRLGTQLEMVSDDAVRRVQRTRRRIAETWPDCLHKALALEQLDEAVWALFKERLRTSENGAD
jgi:hypothetical protein